MVNNEKNNEYLMDYDEKTLEEQETEFLELEKQRKEKEKIKKKKENQKYNKIVKRSESNVKTPCNKETIGDKMIREELAKEKKMCAERLKIIKDHILSLQRKEEELARKMLQIYF